LEGLRVCLVGCGNMGTQLARQAVTVPGVVLAAVVDLAEERARSLASELGCGSYAGLRDCLARERPDAVIVATPNYTHRDVTVAACEQGKHVFCEKPMALTLRDCDDMIRAAREAGVKLMIGHVMRFMTGFELMKGAIEAGEIGEPILAQVLRTSWGGQYRGWRLDRRLVGGVVFESSIHEIDAVRWLVGDVEAVFARAGRLAGHEALGDLEDSVLALWRFRSGVLGTFESGLAWRMGDHRVKVCGRLGAACLDFAAKTVTVKGKGGPRSAPRHEGEPAVKRELQHFVHCIVGDEEPLTSGREGRAAVEIALAMMRSAEAGREVRLPLEG